MPDFSAIYDKMRNSEMNNWVGGADPQATGESCCAVLLRHLPIDSTSRVLDYGAGIGRVAVTLRQMRPEVASIVGMDIVPEMVRFCKETITSELPNIGFQLLADQNDHYDRFKDDAQAKSRATIQGEHGDSFDTAYAFSVFTHIDINDFAPLLKFVGTLLKPGGRFLFTSFILTPFSRTSLQAGWTFPQFSEMTFERDGAVFIGNTNDRLAFIAYDLGLMESMIWQAGLIPCAIEYGEWRGGNVSQTYQDVIVCRKPHAHVG